MDMQEGLKALNTLLDPYDWFYEVCIEDRRYVVYVHRMDQKQDTIIPDLMMGHQVVVHFASHKLINTGDFVAKPLALEAGLKSAQQDVASGRPLRSWGDFTKYADNLDDLELPAAIEVPDTSTLTEELDRLERICGSNILGEIFFEESDGKNAVTNLSVKYPEVRKGMHNLFVEFGFDAIHNDLKRIFRSK